MGRTVDQEVHAAFVEFRAKEDDKCLSVQCIYCQQIRAKNTSRQKQHLLECPGLRGHPNAPQPQSQPAQPTPNGIGPTNGYPATPNGPTATAAGAGAGPGPGALPTPNGTMMTNGVNPHATPMQTPLQNMQRSAPLPTPGPPTGPPGSSSASASQQPSRPTPKPKSKSSTSSLPAPPLDDVHAAFVEFRAKEEDKCLSVQCIYCQQVRAKNTSRQRQHLLECPTYLSVMKDSIPANNLLHTFPENDVARSLQIPAPTLELDFRMSIKVNPKVAVGQSLWGQRDWVSLVGGQWAGRWGKGIILPGGQDSQIVTKESTTNLRASYMLQTVDEPPAYLIVKTDGWLTGAKDVLDKVNDPNTVDAVNPNTYKYRVNLSMETGDERYAFVNTLMWIASGCRRGHEVIFDSFRVN
ncbi:hypothetical protein ASPWEDRAFT_35866 [Aspergillus wentii DTO 134E9]|uniref:Uncharacterized protein n=1 Tax=Aspergillus wentii DTO 134E9 TaxID=1073089 RepID=A0A1L9RTR2_ASPWE|nr:uncharacterized protein ASPWEDRAFT_35866 [Aspergillus wentii DTO 134E9]OJJ38248.1 hypothetical protein ASPWEDRAFT_35866 [Aspergillus wentii DTO 134E9]